MCVCGVGGVRVGFISLEVDRVHNYKQEWNVVFYLIVTNYLGTTRKSYNIIYSF